MTRVTATEAARQLSDLLDRVYYRGESFELERNGLVVARIVPAFPAARVRDLSRLFAARTNDPQFAEDLASAQEAMNEPASTEDPWER